MDIRDIRIFLQPQMEKVEALIKASLETDIALLDASNKRFREHPGKMLRPALTLLAAGAAGEVTEDTLRYAAATELLHNATLMHDDVVDGATERRGLPTVFKFMGGGPAVLMGDFWLVKCIGRVLSAQNVTFRVVRLYADTLSHLAEGELLQMGKASKGDTTQEDYLRIIYGKTASLFEVAGLTAAISVGASEAEISALGGFARELGLAFQIKDDIFDYLDPSAALGKPVGIDLREQKITQPLLCALETLAPAEQQRVRTLVTQAADKPEYVAEIQEIVKKSGGAQAAVTRMEAHKKAALAYLDILPDSLEKAYLIGLADYVVDRSV
ncbi:MAG: polyprenyl synthetase family protein [Bacteroidales bacterium]|nr:polyprenyl synthetase family protein [Bacteroidales bacterium]